MKCPICNQETTGRFCESCGFELHVLPEGVSDEVIQYENERIEKYKETWEKLQESEKKLEESLGESEKKFQEAVQESEKKEKELSDKLSESENVVKERDSKISEQQADLVQRKVEIDQLQAKQQNTEKTNAELQTKNEQLESKLKESQAEVSSLRTQLESSQNENLQLSKDLDEAKRKASENKGERPKAFILLRGGGDESVGAVYSGRNTYGCVFGDINDPDHQELNITGLKPSHFGIETVGDRFRLVDYVGDITSASGKSAGSKGLLLSNGSRINIGNNIKATFIIII